MTARMLTFLGIGILSLTGWGLLLANRRVEKLAEAPGLVQGRRYAVTLLVDPQAPDWGNVSSVEQASANIQALVQSPSGYGGWLTSSAPRPATQGDAAAFLGGRPSVWTFEGTWTRSDKFGRDMPEWMKNASAKVVSP